jgi:hypothetical protein
VTENRLAADSGSEHVRNSGSEPGTVSPQTRPNLTSSSLASYCTYLVPPTITIPELRSSCLSQAHTNMDAVTKVSRRSFGVSPTSLRERGAGAVQHDPQQDLLPAPKRQHSWTAGNCDAVGSYGADTLGT